MNNRVIIFKLFLCSTTGLRNWLKTGEIYSQNYVYKIIFYNANTKVLDKYFS